jgi:outer membrane protein OmpA-like peptidoglycan-associated protein
MSTQAVVTTSIAVILGAAPAAAEPDRSQHPRIGVMADLYFSTDSAALKWGANRKLGRIAGWCAANPRGVVVIEGHADPRGAEDYNLDLSLARAYAVRRELVDAGVRPERIIVVGYGERVPRGANSRRATVWVTRFAHDDIVAAIRAHGAGVVHPGESIEVTASP